MTDVSSPKKYSQFEIRPSAIIFDKQIAREDYKNSLLTRKQTYAFNSPHEREET